MLAIAARVLPHLRRFYKNDGPHTIKVKVFLLKISEGEQNDGPMVRVHSLKSNHRRFCPLLKSAPLRCFERIPDQQLFADRLQETAVSPTPRIVVAAEAAQIEH